MDNDDLFTGMDLELPIDSRSRRPDVAQHWRMCNELHLRFVRASMGFTAGK